MKIRAGFVSNSSSSSFVCSICGRSEEVSSEDMSYAPDATCVNGHSFCRDHIADISLERALELVIAYSSAVRSCDELAKLVNGKTADEAIEIINSFEYVETPAERRGYYSVNSSISALKQGIRNVKDTFEKTVNVSEFLEMVLGDYDLMSDGYDFVYSLPADLCPICNFAEVRRDDVIKVMIKDMGFKTLDELVNHFTTSRFESHDDLQNYVVGISL